MRAPPSLALLYPKSFAAQTNLITYSPPRCRISCFFFPRLGGKQECHFPGSRTRHKATTDARNKKPYIANSNT